MRRRRMIRVVRSLLAAALLLAGAGCTSEPAFEEVADALARECPPGDAPWREAWQAAETQDHLARLEAVARDLAGRHPDRWEPAWLLGKCLRDRGQPDPESAFREGLERARRAGAPEGVASCANDLAWLAYRAGDLAHAVEQYDVALEAAARAERSDLASFARSNLAAALMEWGDWAGAREQLELAERGLRELGMAGPARWAAHNRATILVEMGDASGARDLLERLHEEAGRAEDAWSADASALVLGYLMLATERPVEAHGWYERVAGADASLGILADLGRGRVALASGEPARAVPLLADAIERAEAGNRILALDIETFLAEAHLRSGDLGAAERAARSVLERSDESGASEAAWSSRRILAKVALLEGRTDDAVDLLEQAIERIEAERAPLDPLEEGLYFLRERADPYADLAAALAPSNAAGRVDRVLRVVERAQARALRHTLDPPSPSRGEATLRTVQAGLDDGDLLLGYLVGEDRGVVVALTANAARVVPIAGRSAIVEPLRAYRRSLAAAVVAGDPAADGPDVAAGVRLAAELLDPVAEEIAEAERVYVVPDRELALLPFAALPAPGRSSATESAYLGDVLETAVLPMVSAPARWTGGRTPLLLAGQPELDPDSGFADLPWAAYELSRLRALWGEEAATYVGGAELSLDGLRTVAAGRYRTVHLATHAVASSRDPRRCGVVLSRGERLGIPEIVDLDLDGSLVVLSACRTGEGELLPGEGVIGLSWAFLRAGARGIVVSQWTVDDVASAQLMVAFHEHLHRGEDPVRALTLARRQIARERTHPAFWAPFVLVVAPQGGPSAAGTVGSL